MSTDQPNSGQPMDAISAIEERTEAFRENFNRLSEEIGKVIVGNDEIVRGALAAIFAGGHALLEGVPGLGKTMLVRTISQCLSLSFSRIQFTPDLMPADIVGTNVIDQDQTGARSFRFERGPVFANVLLADEINRATPKTQSALLEAMQEHSVTVAQTTYKLEEPFLVLATQNPLEMEGTYPLPEAQVDRFLFKLIVRFPDRDELTEILVRTTDRDEPDVRPVLDGPNVLAMRTLVREVPIATHVRDYAVRLVLGTHPDSPEAVSMVKQFVRYGASPRAAQSLILAAKINALLDGRYNASFDDVAAWALPAMRHRVILNFEGEAEAITTDQVLNNLLEEIPRTATANV